MRDPEHERTRLCAALPWYDLPCWRGALDRCWSRMRAVLADRGCTELPETLDRTRGASAQWSDTGLLLSQCCGPDLLVPAGAALEPLGRPVFADVDATPGAYFSHILEPLRRRHRASERTRVAVNAPSSRSGCLAMLEWLEAREAGAPSLIFSGSHEASLSLLRRGEADLAAIDAHSWHGLDTAGVRIIGRSREAPSPPWVRHAACPLPAALVREALEVALAAHGGALGISGIVQADRSTYAADAAPVDADRTGSSAAASRRDQ